MHYYSADKVTLAIKNFKVIEEYPATVESQRPGWTQNIYIDAGDVKSYFDYIEGLSEVSVSVSAQDSITLTAKYYMLSKIITKLLLLLKIISNFSAPIFSYPLIFTSRSIICFGK